MAAHWPKFWSTPFKYMKWAAIERPALFYSTVIGSIGPIALLVVPPLRRKYLYEDRPMVPKTYPIPKGKRVIPEGYDDETGE